MKPDVELKEVTKRAGMHGWKRRFKQCPECGYSWYSYKISSERYNQIEDLDNYNNSKIKISSEEDFN